MCILLRLGFPLGEPVSSLLETILSGSAGNRSPLLSRRTCLRVHSICQAQTALGLGQSILVHIL